MSLVIMPDLCMLAIFKHLPLYELDYICQVWPAWCPLKKLTFNKKTHLKLQLSTEGPFTKELDTFVFDELRGLDEWLVDNYKCITSLEVEFVEQFLCVREVTSLLSGPWRSKLTSLKVSSRNFDCYEPLYRAINAMPSLRRLSIDYLPKHFDQYFELPVLGQLEKFRFGSCALTVLDQLIKYARPNASLRRIDIDTKHGMDSFQSICEQLVDSVDWPFASKFASIFESVHPNLELSVWQPFFAHFRWLTVASIDIKYDQSLPELLKCLVPLKKLKQLNLHFNYRDSIRAFSDPAPIEPLPSVELFQFRVYFETHSGHQFGCFNFARTFPNVRKVILKHSIEVCFDCNKALHLSHFKRCISRMIWPIKKCPKIEQIEVKYRWQEYYLWTK